MRTTQVVGIICFLVAGVWSGCIDDCSNHGDCNAGQCTCEEGWSGENCGTYRCDLNPDVCSGHGQCRNTSCVCHANYGGYNCAFRTDNCPNFCKGHGSCLNTVCTCDPGYKGVDCGLVDPALSCKGNCSGHGFCDVSSGTPTCYCVPSYWTGEACDTLVSNCPPSLNHCTGRGVCEATDPLADTSPWVCTCQAGFCGDKCDVVCPTCPSNCTGHGMCVGGVCNCFPGFGTADCSRVIQNTACPNNCSGHGLCVSNNGEYSCSCDPGYSTPNCTVSESVCPGGCSGNGDCQLGGLCVCNPGYSGLTCDALEPNCHAFKNCSANGLCVHGHCQCNPGFSGDDCGQACPTGGVATVGCNADLGHGVCMNGTCVCKEGEWSGVGCETPAHQSDIDSVMSLNNPLAVIVVFVVGSGALLLIGGYVFNFVRGKRGLNAIPGLDAMRSQMKGDDFEAAPEKRYASNY